MLHGQCVKRRVDVLDRPGCELDPIWMYSSSPQPSRLSSELRITPAEPARLQSANRDQDHRLRGFHEAALTRRLELLVMSSTSQYAHDDLKSYGPNAPDPIWELVKRYRKICQEKKALQEDILRELDVRERGADLEVENARMALVTIRHGTTATNRRRSSTWAWGSHGQGERPAITDLDGPREDSIRDSDVASRGVSPDRLAEYTSNLPPYARMDAATAASLPSPTSRTSITPTALIPNYEAFSTPADGSVF